MKKGLFGLMLAGVLSSTVALAHGGGEHVMGTVKSIDATTLSVETKEGKQVTFHVDAQTQFEKSGAKTTVGDVKVGERVVVHAMKHGTMLHATVVKFGKQQAAAPQKHEGSDAGSGDGHEHGHPGH
ncbi:MAG: DUF5666 domain-containing protein [Myxococcaceae bacterium]|nr:DUF5666 domain-containing protein [Myxococcaceae bacterium]MCI0672369.1 DUF5666 domain-containing protein [Myxococcaceae bacterium]